MSQQGNHKTRSILVRLAALALTSMLVDGSITAQAPQQAPSSAERVVIGPAAPPAGTHGPGIYPTYVPDDTAGFVPIFDGSTMKNWDGDSTFWRVQDGEIIGESTPEKVVKANTFLIWRGGTVKNFELKVDFRLSGTNSGIQYRSSQLPDLGKWVMKGYQADMDVSNGYTGNIHEEAGRMGVGAGHVVLAPRGMLTRITNGPKYKTVATIGDSKLLRGVVNVGGWNSYHIIARGPVLLQIINGQLMAATIDEDSKNAAVEGLLGLQMHVGPPFKVEYKNILLRKLD